MLMCGLDAGAFERDCPAYHRLDEDPRESNGAQAADHIFHQAVAVPSLVETRP